MADYEWRDREFLDDHFRRYGRQVGARSPEQYATLALRTIERGVRFTFSRTGVIRIGYYDVRSHLFVVMRNDGQTILSLSRKSERHVRRLRASTYDL